MTPRPAADDVARFIALMRERHGLSDNAEARPRPAAPPMTAADGTPAAPLPTTTPEAE